MKFKYFVDVIYERLLILKIQIKCSLNINKLLPDITWLRKSTIPAKDHIKVVVPKTGRQELWLEPLLYMLIPKKLCTLLKLI